jgi:hypothetical protein
MVVLMISDADSDDDKRSVTDASDLLMGLL